MIQKAHQMLRSDRVVAFLLTTLSLSLPASSAPKDPFEKIIDEYTFVGDFYEKEYEPTVSNEIFWRYQFKMPKISFPIFYDITDIDKELPMTKGEGRSFEHINTGRIAYLSGKYEDAKKIWLAGRTRYYKEFPYERRLEYMIGMAYLKIAEQLITESKLDFSDTKVKGMLNNAATFLSWAFIVKKSQKDPVLDAITPKGLYNLAAIYFTYDRFSGAYGAAQEGLDFLNQTGRKEYRPWFRRIIGESYVRNRTYLEAVQEFDTALRQDPDKNHAAPIFSRVGDIYFDLNNYTLAEDAYEIAGKVDDTRKYFNSMQSIYRGEALFWTGKFEAAQKQFQYALDGAVYRNSPIAKDDASMAKLRIADTYLALAAVAKTKEQRKAINEKAELAYFQVDREYPNTLAAKIAQVRTACLELPFYEGKNVRHGRELLEASKNSDLPTPLIEVAWACHTASYAERERTDSMLDRVREFSKKYPESRFLASLVEPVRETQANKIKPLFETDRYRAIEFFEKNRKNLFKKIPDDLAYNLFVAYVDSFKSEKAIEFWRGKAKTSSNEKHLIRQATFLSEVEDRSKAKKTWHDENVKLAKKLVNRKWQSTSGIDFSSMLWRIQQSKSGVIHLPWIYQASVQWSNRSQEDACNLAFPLLVRLYKNPMRWMKKNMVQEDLDVIMTKHFPKVLASDESCAQSLMDFEMKVYEKRPDEITAKYLNRGEWLSSRLAVSQTYILAEAQYERGQKQLANSLWQTVVDKGTKLSPEVNFAKSRLDPNKTEFEGLWE